MKKQIIYIVGFIICFFGAVQAQENDEQPWKLTTVGHNTAINLTIGHTFSRCVFAVTHACVASDVSVL